MRSLRRTSRICLRSPRRQRNHHPGAWRRLCPLPSPSRARTPRQNAVTRRLEHPFPLARADTPGGHGTANAWGHWYPSGQKGMSTPQSSPPTRDIRAAPRCSPFLWTSDVPWVYFSHDSADRLYTAVPRGSSTMMKICLIAVMIVLALIAVDITVRIGWDRFISGIGSLMDGQRHAEHLTKQPADIKNSSTDRGQTPEQPTQPLSEALPRGVIPPAVRETRIPVCSRDSSTCTFHYSSILPGLITLQQL